MTLWQSQPIFISSTFADMQAERDHLRAVVFPALEEQLRARRCHVEWVDLRLGVATASLADGEQRELQVLKVCLAEVRRCRPFLIVLLGDRYGWVPPAERARAAAQEEGMGEDVVGRSVTDLEIRLGILQDPDQQPRSFVYLREPLPYADMPPGTAALFSDAHATDADGPDRAQRLLELKSALNARIPERVGTYAATWDASRQTVTGLDAWGRQVVEDIVAEVDRQIQAAPEDLSWQQAERLALEDFVAERSRDFTGRSALLEEIQSLALSPEAAPEGSGQDWGLCLTGEPGAGKSAVFAAAWQHLRSASALVLAHATGMSTQATSLDSMLLRWIEELAAELRTTPELPDNPGPEDIQAAFASLLSRVAYRRRVVVVIDALDQFEPTPRARQMTWLPRRWPANARLLVTTQPGEASAALNKRGRVRQVPLAPLSREEARQIALAICARYHRSFEPEVIEALLTKNGVSGPAWGNSLWLVLAVEELNLVDAEDFERAKTQFQGTPAEQLRALMLDRVEGLHTDVAGLYRSVFEHAEEVCKQPAVVAFLGAIALSSGGWRESDFEQLMPALTGQAWDRLGFATLRRLFRGQVRQRGALGQWVFTHQQMTEAAKRYLQERGCSEQGIHAELARHLLRLPREDRLRQTEAMAHLLDGGDLAKAAEHYGDAHLLPAELDGATAVLADLIVADRLLDDGPSIATVTDLLQATSSDEAAGRVAGRVIKNIGTRIQPRVRVLVYLRIIKHSKRVLDILTLTSPARSEWLEHMSDASIAIGDSNKALGEFVSAEMSYNEALRAFETIPSSTGSDQRQAALIYGRIGILAGIKGDLKKSIIAHQRSLSIIQNLSLNSRS